MSYVECPDLEQLFVALAEGDPEAQRHLETCPVCAEVLEVHRQLEKDLLRLSDPLPPPNFVHAVMAKVEAQPVPVRREIWTGVTILVASLLAVVGLVLMDASSAGSFGTATASTVLTLRAWLVGLGRGFEVLWSTAALPVTTVAAVMLMIALFGLRRLTGGLAASKVTA